MSMAIPETQLETWSNRGADQGAQNTIASIVKALEAHTWPSDMKYEPYLQGSYPNETNIRADSDVDIVVELQSTFYHNVKDPEVKKSLGFTDGTYSFDDFWSEVFAALTSHYTDRTVQPSNKSIKVLAGSSNRLDADVVPCLTYRNYQGTNLTNLGIKLKARNTGQWIINYPKEHINQGFYIDGICLGDYKGAIRILKNARSAKAEVCDFPSYLIEGLCSNLPADCYSGTRQQTILNCLNELSAAAKKGHLANFLAQNNVQKMFGTEPFQVPLIDGEEFISDMAALWNNWK